MVAINNNSSHYDSTLKHFATIDGSFMGGVLAVCLMMVFGAAFFAYKNLYYAVIKKMYPERDEM